MAKLKICPCGEIPKSLLLVDNGVKWAYATGDCCNEWHVEFRTGYNKLESSECMALAVEAWNLATRKPPNKAWSRLVEGWAKFARRVRSYFKGSAPA
jgi:hypothetical protein